jgi:hypothetical protein
MFHHKTPLSVPISYYATGASVMRLEQCLYSFVLDCSTLIVGHYSSLSVVKQLLAQKMILTLKHTSAPESKNILS